MTQTYFNKSNKIFLLIYLVCLVICFYPVFYQDKIYLINQYNLPKNNILLPLFRFLTSLAEGVFITFIIIYFSFKKIKPRLLSAHFYLLS